MNNKRMEKIVILAAAGKREGTHEWTPGSDVQSLWKRHGWTPPSEKRGRISHTPPNAQSEFPKKLRLVRG